jgi:hypothetical protein
MFGISRGFDRWEDGRGRRVDGNDGEEDDEGKQMLTEDRTRKRFTYKMTKNK